MSGDLPVRPEPALFVAFVPNRATTLASVLAERANYPRLRVVSAEDVDGSLNLAPISDAIAARRGLLFLVEKLSAAEPLFRRLSVFVGLGYTIFITSADGGQ